MPVFSKEINALKQDLLDLRSINNFYGYKPQNKDIVDYQNTNYSLDLNIVDKLNSLESLQIKDINIFLKKQENKEEDLEQSEQELYQEENYFKAKKLDISLDFINFKSYEDMPRSDDLDIEASETLQKLDKIFSFEIARMRTLKSTLNSTLIVQKLNKVHEKIKNNKLSEALNLISRYHNENKKNTILSYLYLELLFAKVSKGNLKTLSKARDVANTVCFLTDKSDERLIRYYRYMYVCREFVYDQTRALQLFRDFVLLDPDILSSKQILKDEYGIILKSLLLFLRFDVSLWNSHEIESLHAFSKKSIAGGAFYIHFIRKRVLQLLESQRFSGFVNVEYALYNIRLNHKKVIDLIVSNFAINGLPNESSEVITTIGHKYLQNIFLTTKLPSYSEFLVNTSLSGIQYLEDTTNDNDLYKMGISKHAFWRMWISKITYEPSLQNVNMLPVEQVLKEAPILKKYEMLIKQAYDYEQIILNDEKYKEIADDLQNIRQSALVSVILGENSYRVFDYGVSWPEIRDYYNNINLAYEVEKPLVSTFLIDKGDKGLFWNLEEIQLLIEAMNLVLDDKTLGVKARLEDLLRNKGNNSDGEYMSISEHLEEFWWVYAILVSIFVILFNIIF